MTKKSPFSADFLKRINETLLHEKARLEKELERFSKKNTGNTHNTDGTFPDYGDKDDENAAEVADFATNLQLEDSLEKELRDVHNAIKRATDGSFGICKYCKNPIDERRLIARPTAGACIECKRAITQEL